MAIINKELGKNKRTKISKSWAYTSSLNQETEKETTSKERFHDGQKKTKERLRGKGKRSASPLGNQQSYNEIIKIKAEAC